MDAVQLLKDSTAAVRVRFESLGVRKTLNRGQIDQAASPFGAEGRMLSAAKRILDSNHPAVRSLTKIKADAVNRWKQSTLPYVEDGVRLLPRTELGAFDAFMNEKRNELECAALELQLHFEDIKAEARNKLGVLFNPNDYPPDVASKFKVEWDYPPLDPPNYLASTSPALYEQEQEKLRQRFVEAAELAEEAFITEFANLTEHLADRLTPEADGSQKIFHASAVENLREFFDRFSKLNLTGNERIEELVATARKAVSGVSPKQIRSAEALRAQIRSSMQGLTARLDAMLVDRPKRKITHLKNQEPNNARSAPLLSA